MSTREFTISLPSELAEAAERQVKSGGYATLDDLIRESLSALVAKDVSLEQWLGSEVVESCREMAAHPARGIPIADVLPRLMAETPSS